MTDTAAAPRAATMDKIVALAKRRGFVYPRLAISTAGSPTPGTTARSGLSSRTTSSALVENVRPQRDDMVGLDAGILMNPQVWEASGHVVNFNDPLVDCKTCKSRFRADHLLEDKLGMVDAATKTPEEMSAILREANLACPHCGNRTLTDARQFNMMFSTTIGPVSETGTQVYLRPETAQGIFVQYKNILASSRVKLPFGVGQIGKAFRNEITPGNFVFRVLEFEQMEIEYFIKPKPGSRDVRALAGGMWGWVRLLGLNEEHVRVREHDKAELSHYSTRTVDFEYDFPGSMGWKELYGLANRTDFDLRSHQESSGVDLTYFDQAANTRYLPHVIEPTFGVDRSFLTVLLDAYDEEATVDVNGKEETRVVLRLAPRIAPYKAAILPLAHKPELTSVARDLLAHGARRLERAWSTTMKRRTSASVTEGRTRSAPRSASRSISTRWKTARSPSATATA